MAKMVEGKRFATLFSSAVLLAVSLPIVQNWRQQPVDSFPLSYYPMFSKKRRGKARIFHIIGHDHEGERQVIPYWFAARGGMNQARKHIKRMVKRGEAGELCERVARNIARSENPRYSHVTSVQVVSGRYRLKSYAATGDGCISEKVHATTTVERER